MSEETKNTETQVETPESQEVVTETTLVSEEITTAEGTTEAAAVSEETTASEEATVSEETSEVTQSPEDFLNNFDWHKYEEGIEAVDESQLKEFEKALEGTVGFVNERDVIEGTVIRLTDRDVIIDINSKSEGVISLNEFRYNSGLSVGD